MTVLTNEQLTRLRHRPHRTRLDLAVYQPNTVLAAQINMPTISRGERQITITVISGDVWSVARGMTCYIGASPNGREARIRAIQCNTTTLTVAENDYNWIDGQYLTVVNFFEPWAVFPRIVLDAQNVPTFYKDFNIAYSDQNEQLDPVVHMGPNHAVWLDGTPTGSFANIWYTSSGTFDPTDDSIPTGYAWVFEGGFPTASFVPDPGYIQYTGGGHFLTSLSVLSNQGKTFIGRRHVMVLTDPDVDGSFPPIKAWGMSSFDGSRDTGGYAIRLWVREEVDYDKIADGALVVIYSTDSEGEFEGKAGGNAENRSSILFAGYIENDSISLNAFTNRLEFRVESITGISKRMATFSATLEDVGDAATWNEMTSMTVDKAVIHYLRWHTTLLSIADFSKTDDTKHVQFIDFERGNIYDAINNIYASTLIGTVCADRQGKIWAEIDINVVNTGSARNIDTAIELTRQDWRGDLDIQVVHEDELSYLEMGGIAYSGVTTGTSDPFLAGAPGDAPSYYGGLERVSGLVLEGQNHLNRLVGLAYASANADFPEVTMPMAGDYRLIDIAPQERVLVTLEPEDTYRGFTWDLKPFIPQGVRYTYEGASQVALMEVTAREETEGLPGESVEIPVDPPFPTFIAPEIDLPPLELPPPIPPLPIDPAPGAGDLVYVLGTYIFARTRNFQDDIPTWEDLTPPNTGANSVTGAYSAFLPDPVDPENRAWLITRTTGGAYGFWLYRVDSMNTSNPIFTQVLSAWDVVQLLGAGNFQCTIYDVDVSPMDNDVVYVIGSSQSLGTPNGYILRSLNAGGSFVKMQHTNYGRQQATPNLVEASEHSLTQAYAMPGTKGGNSVLVITFDLFGNYTELHNYGDYQDWHVPYQGNTADLGIYISNGFSASKRLYYSEDRGVTLTHISPSYLGNLWAVRRPGSPFGKAYRAIQTHPSNRLFVAALLQKDVAEPGDKGTILFTSSTGPENLVQTFDFSSASNVPVQNLRWHRTNVNLLYAVSNNATIGRLLYTQDGGLSWKDHDDSFYDQLISPGTWPTIVAVQPIWTA